MHDTSTYALPNAETAEFHELVHYYRGVLQRGWRLIALSSLACLFLAAMYLATTHRMYEATARLLVLQQGNRPINVAGNDTTQAADRSDDYIATHALIVSSPLVVGRAIEKLGLKNLPTLGAAQARGLNPVEEAIGQLNTDRPDRLAKILRVNYRARSREEAIRTVGAIIDSYQKFLEESFQKKSSEIIVLLGRARDDLSNDLTALEGQYRAFRHKNKTLMADNQGRSFISLRLEQLYRSANEAKVKALHLKTQLELGKKLSEQGTGLWAIAHAIEQVGASPTSPLVAQAAGFGQGASLDYIRQLSQEQQRLSERYGPQNAKVIEIKEQIDRIQEETHAARNRLERGDTRDLLAAVSQSLKAINTMQTELKQEFDHDLADAKEIEDDLLAESNLRDKLDRQRALFNTVVDQLKQAQFVSDYSSISAQTIEAPNSLRRAVSPRIKTTLALALALGGVLGVLASVAVDRLDQRVRTFAEIRQFFDGPVLAQVPQFPHQQLDGVGCPALVAHALPRSAWTETYRAARANLEFLRRNRRLQVIMLTSPMSGDGKTTTSSNLAISLAHAGRKVLLIDADLRRPSLDKIHDVRRETGLVHLLRDLMPIPRVIQKTAVENLHVIASGPVVANPAELLASSRFAEVLDELREMYDLILVDTSPLLAVADALVIGASVDGTLLVVKPMTLKRNEAGQTAELLGALGTPFLGTIINGFDGEQPGYHISYGTRYGAGYGYGYGIPIEGDELPETERAAEDSESPARQSPPIPPPPAAPPSGTGFVENGRYHV